MTKDKKKTRVKTSKKNAKNFSLISDQSIRKLTRAEIILEAQYLFFAGFKELNDILNDRNSHPVGRLALASIYFHAIKDGDYKRLQMLFDNIVGRLPVALNVQKDSSHPFEHILKNMSDAELDRKIKSIESVENKPEIIEAQVVNE